MGTKLTISEKPLSVNRAWKGRRYRSDDYEAFRELLFVVVPRPEKMYVCPLRVTLYWGMKNHKASDVDNPTKPLLDVLDAIGYYKDDNQIYELRQVKIPAQKEWMRVVIEPIDFKAWLQQMKAEVSSLFS